VRQEATLLCAIAFDEGARALVACARSWAHATRSRPLFVHARAPGAADAAARLGAMGVGGHELRLLEGEPGTAVAGVIAGARPWLSLVGGSPERAEGVGPTGAGVLREAASPVGVLPAGAARPAGPVVCAVSLGADDEPAVRFASALATASHQPLLVESVLGPRDAVREAAARARGAVQVAVRHDTGARADALTGRLVDAAAALGAGMLVLAADHGDGDESLRAQVAARLRTAAPCLVVSVPR